MTEKTALKKRLCDKNCNECPFMMHENSRMITYLLNTLYTKFGNEVYRVVQEICPNLTCCFDCHIDDFTHKDGCWILKAAMKRAGLVAGQAKKV